MPVRFLLAAVALAALAGCHNSRDKAPIPDDPGPTSPAIRLDTTVTRVDSARGIPAAAKPD